MKELIRRSPFPHCLKRGKKGSGVLRHVVLNNPHTVLLTKGLQGQARACSHPAARAMGPRADGGLGPGYRRVEQRPCGRRESQG